MHKKEKNMPANKQVLWPPISQVLNIQYDRKGNPGHQDILPDPLNPLPPKTRRQAVNKRPESHIWHSICIAFTGAQLTLQRAIRGLRHSDDTNTTKHLL